jgi:hypothetical protein
MCAGTPAAPDDLDDNAYTLVAATISTDVRAADAVSDEGLDAMRLPVTYPIDVGGRRISHDVCQPIGQAAFNDGVDGIWCRSACTPEGRGRELAWFTRGQAAAAVWDTALPFGRWRYASLWADLGEAVQPDPA